MNYTMTTEDIPVCSGSVSSPPTIAETTHLLYERTNELTNRLLDLDKLLYGSTPVNNVEEDKASCMHDELLRTLEGLISANKLLESIRGRLC